MTFVNITCILYILCFHYICLLFCIIFFFLLKIQCMIFQNAGDFDPNISPYRLFALRCLYNVDMYDMRCVYLQFNFEGHFLCSLILRDIFSVLDIKPCNHFNIYSKITVFVTLKVNTAHDFYIQNLFLSFHFIILLSIVCCIYTQYLTGIQED